MNIISELQKMGLVPSVKAKDGVYLEESRRCYQCAHKREIPWDAHIKCAKPDPEMTGNPHGIRSGWFAYPINFDPTWMTTVCSNFEPKE